MCSETRMGLGYMQPPDIMDGHSPLYENAGNGRQKVLLQIHAIKKHRSRKTANGIPAIFVSYASVPQKTIRLFTRKTTLHIRLGCIPQIRFYDLYSFRKFLLCIFIGNRRNNDHIFSWLPVGRSSHTIVSS